MTIVRDINMARAKARAMLKEFEGLRLETYHDGGSAFAIGYGHTVTDFQKCTVEDAERWLDEDIQKALDGIPSKIFERCNTNQIAALISFVFNVGATQAQASTMFRMIEKGNMNDAANQFLRWIYAKNDKGAMIVLKGLKLRRDAERTLFKCERDMQ